MTTPEERARETIDQELAEAGWIVQSRDETNLSASLGIAIREFPMQGGRGYADYLLFVNGEAVGVLEAKPEGHTLSGVEIQANDYTGGFAYDIQTPVEPLPFRYISTGTETVFWNHLDPRPRSRNIFQFHRPETLSEWLAAAIGVRALDLNFRFDFRGGGLPIHVASLANLHNDDDQHGILNLIKNAVAALPDSIQLLRAQLLASGWSWVVSQRNNSLKDAPKILLRNGSQVLGNRLFELEPISCHALSDRREGLGR